MNKKHVRKSYDKEAKLWNGLMITGDSLIETNINFFDLIKKMKKTTILDLGCGSGTS